MEQVLRSNKPRFSLMWNLTSYDVNRIKGQLQARRARIDAEYADVETLERVAAVLAVKYKASEPADPPGDSENGSEDSSRIEPEAAPETQLAGPPSDGSSPDT